MRESSNEPNLTSVSSLAGITISIPGSKMSVVQVDGGNKVGGHTIVDSVRALYPGERVDLVVELQNLAGDTSLKVTLDQE
jgi:FtsP/CotA-like multicopper oxidase with cupredoxin domain